MPRPRQAGATAAALLVYATPAQVHRRALNTAYAPRLFNPSTRRSVTLINRLLR